MTNKDPAIPTADRASTEHDDTDNDRNDNPNPAPTATNAPLTTTNRSPPQVTAEDSAGEDTAYPANTPSSTVDHDPNPYRPTIDIDGTGTRSPRPSTKNSSGDDTPLTTEPGASTATPVANAATSADPATA